MQRSTRSQEPGLEAGIETSARKKKVDKTSKILEESISRTKSRVEVELSKEIHAPEVVIEHQQEEDVGPSKSIGEKDAATEEFGEGIPIEDEEAVEVEPPVTMNPPSGGRGGPPPPQPMPPIDPLVKPRGLPIRLPPNLAPRDMPADLPKFYETRDGDPSRHMERYTERMIIPLITNQGFICVVSNHIGWRSLQMVPGSR